MISFLLTGAWTGWISQNVSPNTSGTDGNEYYFNPTTVWILLAEPVDGIFVVHNPFRRDMEQTDDAAFEMARGREGLSTMAGRIPQERWQMVMPKPVFIKIKEIIKKAIGSDGDELTRRISNL